MRRGRCHYCNYSAVVPDDVPGVRGAVPRAGRLRHRARGAGDRHGVSRRRASRASTATPSGKRGAAAALLGALRARRDRRARRHADDRQGARLPARHAGRRRLGGRRPRPRRLPRRRAHLPAADAGGGAGGPRRGAPARRSSRRSIPEHYSIRHARRQDYRAFFEEELAFRRAMRYPPFVALTNGIVRGAEPGGRDARRRHARAASCAAGRALTASRCWDPRRRRS